MNEESRYIGSRPDDFLEAEGLAEEVNAAALKRVIAWQLAEAMKQQKVTKKALAERMHTSRTAVDRVLDQNDSGMTLATLASAARALGQRVEVRLVPDNAVLHLESAAHPVGAGLPAIASVRTTPLPVLASSQAPPALIEQNITN